MISEEERNAIEYYKNYSGQVELEFKTKENNWEELKRYFGITEEDSYENHRIRVTHLLNLIETQNKMIELMARKINEAYFEENNYWLWFEKEICPKENGKYKFGCIAERIVKLKEYFRNKAKESKDE